MLEYLQQLLESYLRATIITNMQVDEGTVSGKRFLKSKQYPYAQIYEYSKYPGVVQTNIMREVPASLSWVAFFVLKRLRLLESSECGNDSIIDAALTPPGTSGAYFFRGKGRTINSSVLSQDAKLAHELRETTSDLLSVTPFGNKRNSF